MDLSRRGFLGTMIGGVAASAAVRTFPFRVFSFPETVKVAQPLTLRFIRAYDPMADKMISRWDVLSGFGKLTPYGMDFCKMDEVNSGSLSNALDRMEAPLAVKSVLLRQTFPKEPFVFSVEHPS